MYPKDGNFVRRVISLRGDSRTDKILNMGYGTIQPWVVAAFKSSEIFLGQPCIETPSTIAWRFIFDRSYVKEQNIGGLPGVDDANSFSIRGWFKLTAFNTNNTWSTFFSFTNVNTSTSSFGLYVNNTNSKLQIISNASPVELNYTFPLNTWTYVDLRYRKGVGYRIYINGNVLLSHLYASAVPIAKQNFTIGSSGSANADPWYGKMQDVVFENSDTYDDLPFVPKDLSYAENPCDIELKPFALSSDPRPINPNKSKDYQLYNLILQGNSDLSIRNYAPSKTMGDLFIAKTDNDNQVFNKPSYFFDRAIQARMKFPPSIIPTAVEGDRQDSFTITCWHKQLSTPVTFYHSLFGTYVTGGDTWSMFLNTANKYSVYGVDAANAITLNQWYHLRFAYRKNVGAQLYVNGVKVIDSPWTNNFRRDRDFIIGGNSTNTDFMNGWIADFTISKKDTYNMNIPTPYVESLENDYKNYIGDGTISGIVSIEGVPSPNALAYLYDEETGKYIQKIQCDSSGKFTFNNLRKDILYYVVAKSDDQSWEYRVSSRRKPV